jgi:tetratricopeptide (TPR) repeat protein
MKKKALPKINWQAVETPKTARLQRWVTEWRLHEDAEQDELPSPPPAPLLRIAGSGDSLVAPFDRAEPVRGEIRLLSSRLLPAPERPVYVLVLGDWEDGLKLVAPFGPMMEPATRSELKTRRDDPSLSVLCLWNTHSVPTERLKWGWVIDQMNDTEVEEAWAVFKHAATGSPLSAELEDRVGLPILSPEDPRIIYQDREFQLLAPLSEGIIGSEEKRNVVHFPSFAREVGIQQRAIAASSGASRLVIEHLHCAAAEAYITVVFNAENSHAVLCVCNKKGDPTNVLADASVVDPSGVPLATINGAFASFSLENSVPSLALRSASGDLLTLEAPAHAPAHHSLAALFARACNPDAPALFSDSQLARLFSLKHLPAEISASLSGEILLRLWLYRGESSPTLNAGVYERLSAGLRETFDRRKASDGLKEMGENSFASDSCEHLAWSLFSRRASSFLRADGLIPVLVGGEKKEAVPVPFRFEPGLPLDLKAMDAGGHAIAKWVPMVNRLEADSGKRLGFVVDVNAGEEAEHFEGESLALPLLVARLRSEGVIPDLHPLRVLASGVWGTGGLTPADGLEAKAALARRMGAQFLSIGTLEGDIPTGTNARDVHQAVLPRLEGDALLALTPRQLRDAIRLIGDEMRSGQITLGTAERRLNGHQNALDSSGEDGLSPEARLLALSLRGAIFNHKGDADQAALCNEEARKEALKMNNPRAYVEASANQVVSLTDLGDLKASETIGRQLLHWVRTQMQGSTEDKKRAEMSACGALGGQTLLQSALAGAHGREESLELLERALRLAREIEDGRDICMDAVQIAGWHALLESETTEEAFHQALEQLQLFPSSVHAPSLAYLLRIRFLGPYRHWLSTGTVSPGFETWELPPKKVSHLSWVLASALKYRGTLFAANGQFHEAAGDFKDAVSLLERQAPPVLRFMSATVSLRAFLSLRAHDAQQAAPFLERARSVFSAFNGVAGPALEGSAWLRVCAIEDPAAQEAAFREKQLAFPY